VSFGVGPLRSTFPSFALFFSVNQTLPSGPPVMPKGPLAAVGAGNSVTVPVTAMPVAGKASVATSAPASAHVVLRSFIDVSPVGGSQRDHTGAAHPRVTNCRRASRAPREAGRVGRYRWGGRTVNALCCTRPFTPELSIPAMPTR
jgi:hypothetical protein